MNYPSIDLPDAVVLVTGGGRGIGRATARLFAQAGARVFIGDLDGDAARDAATTIGPRVTADVLDVTSGASWAAWVASVLARDGHIDILVNNAGVMPLGGFLEEPDPISRSTLDVNVWGPLQGMRKVLPHLVARGRGHVVNVASMAGKLPIPGMAVYNASKFAALGLSLAVREEFAERGVSVSAVLPAIVRTELASGVPHGGLPAIEPEEVARAIVDSVRSREAEIAVPRYLGLWDLIDAVAPESAMRRFRRRMGGNRALTSVDPVARAAYARRIAAQAMGRG